MAQLINVGDTAPDLMLKDQDNQDILLSGLRGNNVLLSFHPLAWTPVCRDQMISLETNLIWFEKYNTVPLGISVDPVPSKTAWAQKIDVNITRLLSDFWPHGEAADRYGLLRMKEGFSQRANVIVDSQGIVRFVKVYEISQLPDIEEILAFIKDMSDGTGNPD